MKYTFAQLKDSYTPLWQGMVVVKEKDAQGEASKIVKNKTVYQDLETKTGVPWFCIGIIHTREAGSVDVGRWQCVLHNGERLVGTGRKTRLVPAGKGPFATFQAAAEDALSGYSGLTWTPEFLAYTLEKFNGFGYRGHGIPSPYLWGGTNRQKRGKYVSDGQYDANAMDPQVGGMALLYEVQFIDATTSFQKTESRPAQPVEVPTIPSNPPTSHDNTKPSTPAAPYPVPTPSKATGFAAVLAASLTWLKDHRLAVVLTAVGVAASAFVYVRYVRPKLWTNPSPKAVEPELPVQDSADDKTETAADVK